MNRREYNSDPRYAKVLEQMDLLGIIDISTTRQDKKWYNSMETTYQKRVARKSRERDLY